MMRKLILCFEVNDNVDEFQSLKVLQLNERKEAAQKEHELLEVAAERTVALKAKIGGICAEKADKIKLRWRRRRQWTPTTAEDGAEHQQEGDDPTAQHGQ